MEPKPTNQTSENFNPYKNGRIVGHVNLTLKRFPDNHKGDLVLGQSNWYKFNKNTMQNFQHNPILERLKDLHRTIKHEETFFDKMDKNNIFS